MRYAYNFQRLLPILGCLAALASTTVAFEGRIHAVVIQGNETNALLYTVGEDSLRVEMTVTNGPNPVDILDRNSGTLTLLFPSNRSFVQLKHTSETAAAVAPSPLGMPMPPSGLPPGIGPQSTPGAPPMPAMPNMPALPPGVGPQTQVAPAMPPMPSMPMMQAAKLELQATRQKTNLLGFACQQYVLKQRGETLEVWATDQLLPYQPYVQNQPHRFEPRMIKEQWPAMLASRKLFPLLASLHYGNGGERFRFEVQSVVAVKLTNEESKRFQPPTDYHEIEPIPF